MSVVNIFVRFYFIFVQFLFILMFVFYISNNRRRLTTVSEARPRLFSQDSLAAPNRKAARGRLFFICCVCSVIKHLLVCRCFYCKRRGGQTHVIGKRRRFLFRHRLCREPMRADFSFPSCKYNPLRVGIHRRMNAERENAARLCVPDGQVADNGQRTVGDDLEQRLFIGRVVCVVHRLADEHAGNRLKYAGIAQIFQRAAVFFGRRFFFRGFEQQDLAAPLCGGRKQAVPTDHARHVRICCHY